MFDVLFQLDSLQGDNLGPLFHQPTGESEKDEEVLEEEGEESDEDPEVYHHRSTKRPRAATVGAEGSAKKAKTAPSSSQRKYDAKCAERERMKMLRTAGQGSQPTLPGAS